MVNDVNAWSTFDFLFFRGAALVIATFYRRLRSLLFFLRICPPVVVHIGSPFPASKFGPPEEAPNEKGGV